MLGHLYDRALGGERCGIGHEDGEARLLPAHRWLHRGCDGLTFIGIRLVRGRVIANLAF
jgi:hypothetical protein